jgi:hypothetical protein
MRSSARLRIITAATAAAAAILPLAAAGQALAAPTARPAHPAAAPGRTANPITLDNGVQLDGYDAATDPSGNTYIGWISDKDNNGRKVHLCMLPLNARKCLGGVQTIDSLGDSSAEGLKVLVSSAGEVTLVWFHDTTASTMGPQGGQIATATSDAGGPLNGPFDMASAPSFGSLLDARLGPGNAVWTVAAPAAGKSGVQVHNDIQTPGNLVTVLKTPYQVGSARLRFHGNDAVLAIQKYGAVTTPVAYASDQGSKWTAFRKLAKTWTSDAVLGLVGTASGIRLVTSVNNANYYPVSWSWTGSTFAHPTLTGDFNHCSPSSHDLVSDGSGRVADVSVECGDLAIANLTDTRHAAVVRFKGGGIFAGGDPQIATTARGKGWVFWSIEAKTANKLLAAPILLPGRPVTASKTVKGNRVTLTGPASCLPAVTFKVGLTGKPARNWHVLARTLHLGGAVLLGTKLNGAALTPSGDYTLSGTVRFGNGTKQVSVTAQLRFESCPLGTTSG